MFESSEAFTAHATISAGYWMLQKEQERLNIHCARPPIVREIDRVTGYDDDVQKEIANNIVTILKDVIEAKILIQADYSADKKMVDETLEFINQLTSRRER